MEEGIYKSYWVFKNSKTGRYMRFNEYVFNTVPDLIGAKMFNTYENAKYFKQGFQYRLEGFDIYEIKVKEYMAEFNESR